MPWQQSYNLTHSRNIVDIHEYYTDAAYKLHIAALSGGPAQAAVTTLVADFAQVLNWQNGGKRKLAEIAPTLRTGARRLSSQNKSRLLSQHETNNDLNTPLLGQTMQNAKDLGADDIFSPLDERIIAAASEAMEAGETHYVDVPGIAPLRAAVAEFLNDSTGAAYQSGNIVVTAGAQESRFLTIQKIGELYDSIGVPAVTYIRVCAKRSVCVSAMSFRCRSMRRAVTCRRCRVSRMPSRLAAVYWFWNRPRD